MFKVGLTGGIGSGKSAVADSFQNLGITVIDTDIIARELVDDDETVLKEIIDTFGRQMLNQQGKLDRKKLAQTVFNNKQNKQLLENILHPKVRQQVSLLLQDADDTSPYCIIVVPLLLETDFHNLVDHVLVVMSDEKIRINRVKQRDGRDLDEIRAIIENQTDDENRQSKADDTIKNDSTINELEQQVALLHKKYLSLSPTFK